MISNIYSQLKNNKSKLAVLSDQALVSGVNFLVTLLLARFLDLENFGLYALGWMLVLFFSSLQLAFVISPLFTLYPRHSSKEHYLKSLHSIQLVFTAVVFIVGMVFIQLVTHFKPEWVVPGTSWSLPLVAALFGLQDFYRRLNISKSQSFQTLLIDLFSYGVQPIIILILHFFGELSIHFTYLAMAILFGISAFIQGVKLDKEWRKEAIVLVIKENWEFSKYLLGTALLQWVSGNFFILAAGTILTPLAIGIIRIAQNVVGLLNVMFSALENIVPLKASQLLGTLGVKNTLHYFKHTLLVGGLMTFLTLTVISLSRNYILEWFYGSQYLAYGNVILGFAVIYFFVFINTILGFLIRTFEMNKIFLYSYVCTSVFSVLAAKPIISSYGVYGVIIGLLAAQILNIGVYTISIKSKLLRS